MEQDPYSSPNTKPEPESKGRKVIFALLGLVAGLATNIMALIGLARMGKLLVWVILGLNLAFAIWGVYRLTRKSLSGFWFGVVSAALLWLLSMSACFGLLATSGL